MEKVDTKTRWDVCLLSTAYLPPVSYFVAMAQSKESRIASRENYQKQSYRSRCHILSPNGVQALSIPIKRGGEDQTHKVPIDEIEIDYSFPWVHNHKRALDAAYRNSPFYEYYAPEIFSILDNMPDNLLELNSLLTVKLLSLCSIPNNLHLDSSFTPAVNEFTESGSIDLREIIQPKFKGDSFLKHYNMEKPYWQVFAKQGFVPNLSIVDLLFNEGPNSAEFLLLK